MRLFVPGGQRITMSCMSYLMLHSVSNRGETDNEMCLHLSWLVGNLDELKTEKKRV